LDMQLFFGFGVNLAAGNEVGQDFLIRYVSQIRSDSSEATQKVSIIVVVLLICS